MFFLPTTLPIIEHDSALARAIDRKPLGTGAHVDQLSVSPLRVAGAIAKTIYANPTPAPPLKVLLSAIAFANVQWLSQSIGSTRNLRLSGQHLQDSHGLRDFSRSTRVGEYGQGVCALFMQDKLGLPIVLDFGVLCDLLGATPPVDQDMQPDFAGWSGGDFKLVESKSSFGSSSIKTELRKGLLQCDAGANHLTVQNAMAPAGSYAVLTSFQPDKGALDSKIHFADPTDRGDFPADEVHDRIAKHYYVSALQAMGVDRDRAQEFLAPSSNGEQAGIEFPALPRQLVPVVTAELPPFLRLDGERASMDVADYRLYMDKELLEAVRSGNPRDYVDATKVWTEATVRVRADMVDRASAWTVWSDGLVMYLAL